MTDNGLSSLDAADLDLAGLTNNAFSSPTVYIRETKVA